MYSWNSCRCWYLIDCYRFGNMLVQSLMTIKEQITLAININDTSPRLNTYLYSFGMMILFIYLFSKDILLYYIIFSILAVCSFVLNLYSP